MNLEDLTKKNWPQDFNPEASQTNRFSSPERAYWDRGPARA